MLPFDYEEAHEIKGAQQIHAASSRSAYLAGGTNLIDLMKLHIMTPNRLVDVTALPLKQIKDTGEHVEVGALVNNNDMAAHPLIKSHFPAVSLALLSGASVQLRNLATTGGNVLQRTRCSYFRDPALPCNKREPGSGCSAQGGFNRMNAVLGTSEHCLASHPSDLAVALMALGAGILSTGKNGVREIPIEQFYTLPGNTPHIENVLEEGELITSVRISKTPWFQKSTYVKVRDRASYAFALTSAAVALDLHGKTVRNIRIALGGVGTVPWRGTEGEKILTGQPLSFTKAKEAADAIMAHSKPYPHNEFKIELAKRTLLRALEEVGGKLT